MKILIGCPTYDRRIDAGLARTLRNIEHKGNHLLDSYYPMSSLITWSRNQAVEFFLKGDYEALLFLDSDIEITDEDFVDKLITAGYKFDAKIVGGSYRMKQPDMSTVYIAGEQTANGKRNFTELAEARLCDFAGTGCLLIFREILEKMSPPYFQIIDTKEGYTLPEDYNFCGKAKELGFKIAVVPIQTRHWGQFSWNTYA